ncbi:hypothetical protein SAMN06297164_0610 [Nitrosomonas ureae]|uniref:Uncharacterized protein n=1 Tax=Nitrosomonas ureae TaxID=44577 RepID=A0A286A3N7_9PROT|nr:hypothetical protein SAMN06297164_0610 [Nitrosomonas ureae]
MEKISHNTVADFFLYFAHEHGDYITNLRLQKLVYYAQGWYLARNKQYFIKPARAGFLNVYYIINLMDGIATTNGLGRSVKFIENIFYFLQCVIEHIYCMNLKIIINLEKITHGKKSTNR